MAQSGGLDEAVEAMVGCIRNGGVLQAFGTGHSQAFAMEIAGRAGGLIPTHAIALRDTVLKGDRPASDLEGGLLERDTNIANELWELQFHPEDVFLIASNSGVNGSIVGIAQRAKEEGHTVIAVTSLEHTNAVTPKHPSGKRLAEIADVVIDGTWLRSATPRCPLAPPAPRPLRVPASWPVPSPPSRRPTSPSS